MKKDEEKKAKEEKDKGRVVLDEKHFRRLDKFEGDRSNY